MHRIDRFFKVYINSDVRIDQMQHRRYIIYLPQRCSHQWRVYRMCEMEQGVCETEVPQ